MEFGRDQIDPRVQEAADEFRAALEELRKAQDPFVREVLRREALNKLSDAVDITEVSEQLETTRLHYQSKN